MKDEVNAVPGAATRAVRAGLVSDPQTGAVVPPLHLSTTYAFLGYGEKRTYDYSRTANPTRDLLATALADQEGGAGAIITASGMGAITLVGHLFKVGARIVAPHDCYGGSHRLFSEWQRRGEFLVEFVDYGDEPALRKALSRPAQLVWIETPSNPLLRITDIAAVAAMAHVAGALVAVDNTFLSPAWQQPLRLGADLVVHSTTKYINGHSDVVGGAVIARTQECHQQLFDWANNLGLERRGVRQLPDAARPAHAPCAARGAWPQRTDPGRMAGQPAGREPRLVSGPAHARRACHRGTAAAGLWGHHCL